jgi:hypothetical protein
MIGFAAQRLMELDVESLTGARHGEHDPKRPILAPSCRPERSALNC